MDRVLIYRSSLLSLSETFIKEQVLAYRRWRGTLVGMRRVSAGLRLDGLDLCLLRPDHPDLVDRIFWKFALMSGTLPPHVVEALTGASLLHVHFGPDALEAWPLARVLKLPMLVTLHGYDINIERDWWEAGHGGRAMRKYPLRLLELAQHPSVRFIAVSDAIRRRAISYGIPVDKLTVHHIGVDITKFAPGGRPIDERERRVLFVGRLVEKKGCEYLIRSFAHVQQALPDASLIIVGDGHMRDKLKQLARQLGVHAQFRGALSSAEVQKELHVARVFCLPSVTAANGDAEGLPTVLLEAQASGVPVITSARGGVEEAVCEGTTGFTFQERNVDTLAARLCELLRSNRTARSMAAAGPRFIAEKFDIGCRTAELELHYDKYIAGPDAGGH
jgi:glycosyltransferase involved in cell wall biosynthesis